MVTSLLRKMFCPFSVSPNGSFTLGIVLSETTGIQKQKEASQVLMQQNFIEAIQMKRKEKESEGSRLAEQVGQTPAKHLLC